MDDSLKNEFKYYLDNQEELVKKYDGRVLVIKGCQVVGDYSTEAEAIDSALSKYEPGTFIVQKCSPGDKDYKMVFHSRVAFV